MSTGSQPRGLADGNRRELVKDRERVLLGHGSGGKLTHQLVQDLFVRYLSNPILDAGDDAGIWEPAEGPVGRLADTRTASFSTRA